METGSIPLVILAALAIGGAFGAAAQASHFCTMGAISDWVLFGSRRRLQGWALAIATALLGTQVLAAIGLIDTGASFHARAGFPFLGLVAGGLMFGFGMVLAGGCASRNLVRLGGGSIKALLVVALMAASAEATLAGAARFLPAMFGTPAGNGLVVTAGGDVRLGSLLFAWTGIDGRMAELALALAIALAVALWAGRNAAPGKRVGELLPPLVIGATIPLAWLAATFEAGDSARPLLAMAFVRPAAWDLGWLLLGVEPFSLWAALLPAAVILGAFVQARRSGRFRIETFANRDDLKRHVTGALLMGPGGVLALGCTIGQAMSGVSVLAASALVVLPAICAGAVWALRYLETGRLTAMFRRGPAT